MLNEIKEKTIVLFDRSSVGVTSFSLYFLFLWLYRKGVFKSLKGLGSLFTIAFLFGIFVAFNILVKVFQSIFRINPIVNIKDNTINRISYIYIINLNNVIYLGTTLMIGFFLIALTNRGLCPNQTIYISDTSCNSRQVVHVLPKDHIIYLLISSLLGPLSLEGIGIIATGASFVLAITMIVVSIIIGDFYLEPLILIEIIMFILLYIHVRNLEIKSSRVKPELSVIDNAVNREAENLEKKLNNALVHQILPHKVAEQIKEGKPVPPEEFDNVTVFFSDVVGFTYICANVPPIMVVQMLNELYTVMDYCCSVFPLYKVETIGDAYMVVGGLIEKDPEHAQRIADFALLVQVAVSMVKSPFDGSPLKLRMGIHSGPVLAGVVGNLMPRYCLFGDTVNTASRMESNGEANRIHCSEAVASILIKSEQYLVSKRGEIHVKGKGNMTTYWLEGATSKNVNANRHALVKVRITIRDLLGLNRDISARDLTKNADSTSPNNNLNIFFSSNYLRILVVEDSQLQRKVLMRLLKSADPSWDITFAATGESALEKLKAAKLLFDVVFVDENLSNSNDDLFGHELVNIMRNSLHMTNCVIIACVSNTSQSNRSYLLSSGVDEVWPKPPPDPIYIYDCITELVAFKRNKLDSSSRSTESNSLPKNINGNNSIVRINSSSSIPLSKNNSINSVKPKKTTNAIQSKLTPVISMESLKTSE